MGGELLYNLFSYTELASCEAFDTALKVRMVRLALI